MSEVRLVRCPKCNKVLQEPLKCTIYQCGACEVVLRGKRSTLVDEVSKGLENSVICDRERVSEKGHFGQLDTLDMADRSPARSTIGDGVSALAEFDEGFAKSSMRDELSGDLGFDPNSIVRSNRVSRSPMRERGSSDFGFEGVGDSSARMRNVSKSPMRERGAKTQMNVVSIDVTKSPLREERTFTEFDEGLPKSPMRERFLNDLVSVPDSPIRSRGVSRSPMRERGSSDFDFDGVDGSSARSRNVSKSPLRERGAKRGTSVRTRDVTRSPLRERRTYAVSDGVSKSPARSMNEDIPELPMRRDNVSESDRNGEMKQRGTMGDPSGMEEEVSGRKMEMKTSFSSWVHGDKHMAQPDDNYSDRRRRTWRDGLDNVDRISEGRESVYSIEHGTTPDAPVDNLVHVIDPSKDKMHRDMRFGGEYVAGYAKPRRTIGQWVPREDGVGGIHGNSKLVVAGGRILASSSSADGSSNYPPDYMDVYGDSRHGFESSRGPSSTQDLELEHAMLLRKYKELKHQLSDLEGERFSPAGSYRGSDDYSADESLRFRREAAQRFMLDKNLRRPHHFNHASVPVPHLEDKYNFAPYLYDDPFSGQVARASHPNRLHQVVKHSVVGHVPGRFDQDSLELYNDKAYYHHPTCSCSLCYVNDWQDQDLPDSLASGISTNFAVNHRSNHSLNIERHGPRAYNPRMAQITPQERLSYLAQHHHERLPVTNQKKRLCYPISGGAPFVLCKKCLRLLKLPKKLMSVQKIRHQLQCGACSAVMSIDLLNRSSALPSSQTKSDSIDASKGLDYIPKESGLEHHRHNSCAATSTNLGSYDFDAIGSGFQSIDSETCEVPKEQESGVSVADSEQRLSPSSSHSSKDHISDNASIHSGLPNSAEMPLKTNLIRPPPGSPLRDHLDYSSHFRKTESGEVASYAVEEKQITEKDTFSESSAENTVVTTEMDVHSSEMPATSLSQDSWDVPREEDKVGNKERKSSMSNFVKWGLASRAGLGSPGRAEVSVNGQFIQHHLVKRAEKLAGPIQHGDYWYDSKAGFWGVMGHHCLGIIPPFIQEFSFPMTRNCSGGDTAVCVNGRELHKRDLGLLSSRGLPITSNKSYIIDISGKVLDEETKEFIVNLGKLAPTVEKKRRGFGMQVPEVNLED